VGPPVVFNDVVQIYKMYAEAQKRAQINHPDFWNTETEGLREMLKNQNPFYKGQPPAAIMSGAGASH